MQNLKKLKGDASHRKFFRKKYNGLNSIVILAEKNKFKNESDKKLLMNTSSLKTPEIRFSLLENSSQKYVSVLSDDFF